MIAVVNPNLSGRDFMQCATELGAAVREIRVESGDQSEARVDELVHELRRGGCEAVVAGSEAGVSTTELLAQRLGLATNLPALARARRHKEDMMGAVAAAGERIPWSFLVRDPGDLDALVAGAPGGRLVVKPTSSAGSDGVCTCDEGAQLANAVTGLLGRTNYLGLRNEGVLVQEFIEGPQYAVNVVSRGGQHKLSDVHLYEIKEFDGKPLIRSRQLVDPAPEASTAMVEYVFRCLDALGVREGASHTEVRMTATGPVLIEVNCRLIGVACPSDVYVAATGRSHAHDLALSLVDPQSFDRLPRIPSHDAQRTVGGVTLRCFEAGQVVAARGLDSIRALDCFHSLRRLPSLGDTVDVANLMTSGNLGMAFFVGPTDRVSRSIELTHVLEESGGIFDLRPVAERNHP